MGSIPLGRTSSNMHRYLLTTGIVLCWLSSLAPLGAQELSQDASWKDLTMKVYQLYNQGAYGEAAKYAEEAVTLSKQTFGEDNLRTSTALNNLARVYAAEGRLQEAESLHLRALFINEKLLGEFGAGVETDLTNLASLYLQESKPALAEPMLKRAAMVIQLNAGLTNPALIEVYDMLGQAALAQGHLVEARTSFNKSLELAKQLYGPNALSVAQALYDLALLDQQEHLPAKAEPLFERVLLILQEHLGRQHPEVANALERYAVTLRALGKRTEALEAEHRASEIRQIAQSNHTAWFTSSAQDQAILD